MIAAWQQAQKHPATGYLTAAESQALRDAEPPAAAIEAEHRVDRPAAPTAGRAPLRSAGSLSGSATGGGAAPLAPMEVDLRLAGRQLIGRIVHPTCGSLPVSLMVDSAGTVSGSLRLPEAAGCTNNTASASGRVAGGTLTLDLRGADVRYPRHAVVAARGGRREVRRRLRACAPTCLDRPYFGVIAMTATLLLIAVTESPGLTRGSCARPSAVLTL